MISCFKNTPIVMKIASELSTINLDANASVPPLESAIQALTDAMKMQGNASSTHVLGLKLRALVDEAREKVAAALGGQENELFFCSGASEGNRWLVDAIIRTGEQAGRVLRVVVSPLEHPSLIKYLDAAAGMGKIELFRLSMRDGEIDFGMPELSKADAVFITAAHNETGYIPKLAEMALPEHTVLISDASQAVARIGVLPSRVDAIVASSHKMGGVVGAGAVLLRGRARKLVAPWAGGGQEAGLRPGSESVPLIAAMGAAASEIGKFRTANQALTHKRDRIEKELLQTWPNAFVVGNRGERLPQTSAICVEGVDPEALRIMIDRAGVCVGFGSACSALAPEPSPSLLAFGLTAKQARATIRISLHPGVSDEEIDAGQARLRDLVRGMIVAR